MRKCARLRELFKGSSVQDSEIQKTQHVAVLGRVEYFTHQVLEVCTKAVAEKKSGPSVDQIGNCLDPKWTRNLILAELRWESNPDLWGWDDHGDHRGEEVE